MRAIRAWNKSVAGFVALLLVASLAGLGGAGQGASAEGEASEWLNPQSLVELVARVQELEWTWTEFEGDVEVETMTVSYRLAGPDIIVGRDTTKVELTVDGDLWRVWLAEDGAVVQAEIAGEVMPQMFAETMVGPMLTGLFWPFTLAEHYGVQEALTETAPGLEVRRVDRDLWQIGDLEVPIYQVEVRVYGEPYLDPGEEVGYIWVIGDFGTFRMLLEWQVSEVQAEDMTVVQMLVKRVVPR